MHQRREYNLVQYRPEPLANHAYEVITHCNGFTIVIRSYQESAAKFEKRFQDRLGSPAQVFHVVRKTEKRNGQTVIVEERRVPFSKRRMGKNAEAVKRG